MLGTEFTNREVALIAEREATKDEHGKHCPG
jgi:hypothetical protein